MMRKCIILKYTIMVNFEELFNKLLHSFSLNCQNTPIPNVCVIGEKNILFKNCTLNVCFILKKGRI